MQNRGKGVNVQNSAGYSDDFYKVKSPFLKKLRSATFDGS